MASSLSYPPKRGRGVNMTYRPPNLSLVNPTSRGFATQPFPRPSPLRGPTTTLIRPLPPTLSYRSTHSLINRPSAVTPRASLPGSRTLTAGPSTNAPSGPILRGPSTNAPSGPILRGPSMNAPSGPILRGPSTSFRPAYRPPVATNSFRGSTSAIPKRGTRTYRRLESLNYVRDPNSVEEEKEENSIKKQILEKEKEKIKQKKLLLEISKVAGIINRYKAKKENSEAKMARKRGRDGNMHYFNGSYLNAKRLSSSSSSTSAHKTLVSKRGYVPNKIVIGGVTYTKSQDGKSLKRTAAGSSSAMKRNLVLRNKPLRSTKKPKKNQYCLFYNRFGKCKRGEGCPYIHDPEKVAVCRKFLKEECDDSNCLLQHKVDKNKMPVCTHYLRGICSRDPCPYLHVNVSNEAAICEAFVKGYCADGENCKLRHVYPKKEKKRKWNEKDEEAIMQEQEDEANASMEDPKKKSKKKRLRSSQQLKLVESKRRALKRRSSLADSSDSLDHNLNYQSESLDKPEETLAIKPNFLVMNQEREGESSEEVPFH